MMLDTRCFFSVCMCAVLTSLQIQAQAPAPPPAPAPAQEVRPPEQPAHPLSTLPEGTPVRMRINRTISSADAHEGDKVDFETLDDVKLGESIIVPKGSTAIGTVTAAQSKRRLARGGKLAMNIDYVRLPSGDKVPLRGIQDVKGGGHTGAMTVGMVATAIVFFPAAPLFLFIKGKDISIPKGHEVTVYTNSDFDLSKVKSPIGPPEAPKALSGPPLTNADVIKLKGAGLGDDLIIDKIKSSPSAFHVETGDMVDLKQAGLSDVLIGAMIQASRR
jgi:hypothetical protein